MSTNPTHPLSTMRETPSWLHASPQPLQMLSTSPPTTSCWSLGHPYRRLETPHMYVSNFAKRVGSDPRSTLPPRRAASALGDVRSTSDVLRLQSNHGVDQDVTMSRRSNVSRGGMIGSHRQQLLGNQLPARPATSVAIGQRYYSRMQSDGRGRDTTTLAVASENKATLVSAWMSQNADISMQPASFRCVARVILSKVNAQGNLTRVDHDQVFQTLGIQSERHREYWFQLLDKYEHNAIPVRVYLLAFRHLLHGEWISSILESAFQLFSDDGDLESYISLKSLRRLKQSLATSHEIENHLGVRPETVCALLNAFEHMIQEEEREYIEAIAKGSKGKKKKKKKKLPPLKSTCKTYLPLDYKTTEHMKLADFKRLYQEMHGMCTAFTPFILSSYVMPTGVRMNRTNNKSQQLMTVSQVIQQQQMHSAAGRVVTVPNQQQSSVATHNKRTILASHLDTSNLNAVVQAEERYYWVKHMIEETYEVVFSHSEQPSRNQSTTAAYNDTPSK